jgi:predicted O-methyltransferase YrrM
MSFYPTYQEQYIRLSTEQKKALRNIPHLEEIEGWLLLIEAAELFLMSQKIESPKPVICEIGTWKGKSSYIFASALEKKNGFLYSIDPFNGDGDSASRDSYQKEISKLDVSLLRNFEVTMKKYNLWNKVKVLPLLSVDARPKFNEKKIDFLFIDGNHDYEAVKKDYLLWSDLIPSGGMIALHDVGAVHVNGPRQVMQEFIEKNPQWKDICMVGEMGVAIKA